MRVRVTFAEHPTKQDRWQVAWDGAVDDCTIPRLGDVPWIDTDPPYADPGGLADAIAVLQRSEESNEIPPEDVGDFLGASLPEGVWQAVLDGAGDGVVELALLCEGEAAVLHNLPWELMRRDGHYVGLLKRPVVVTRLVRPAEPPAQPLAPIPGPPKVLFAVGTRIGDKRVRAGAEFMSLMRELDPTGAGTAEIEAHLADNVSLSQLEEHVQRVKPDVVYIVCHGANGQLLLRDPYDPDRDQPAGPGELADALELANGYPPIVVLSACDGAVAYGDLAMSAATVLVSRGVPVVVAMAGRVTDRACRLFMRRFGTALVKSQPLIEAVAHGRRAARRDSPPVENRADWALPCLYIADHIEHGHVAVEGTRERCPVRLAGKLGMRDKGPAFCGRREYFEFYEQLMNREADLIVLAIPSEPKLGGLGRGRLLRELGAQAVRDGHLPMLIAARGASSVVAPRTVRQFAVWLDEQIQVWRQHLGLTLPRSNLILQGLGADEFTEPDGALLESAYARARKDVQAIKEDVDPGVLIPLIAQDLTTLVDEARVSGWPQFGEHSRPLLLLGRFEQWGDGVRPLLDVIDKDGGIGTAQRPVPVIVSYTSSPEADDALVAWRERTETGETWNEFAELKPFRQDDGEDLLAYTWTLLHPLKPPKWRHSDKVYAVKDHEGEWLLDARESLKGRPAKLTDHEMYLVARLGEKMGEIVEDDDEEVFRQYVQKGMLP